MKTTLVFDADNTLWDTDAVFRNAQRTLLRKLADAQLLENPDTEIPTLRSVDRKLFARMERFEYNFKTLAIAMTVLYKQNLSTDEAIEAAIFYSQTDSLPGTLQYLADKAFDAFQKRLTDIPRLYTDAARLLEVLRRIKSTGNPLVTILLSEGKVERIDGILSNSFVGKIPLKSFFDDVIIRPAKSRAIFAEAKRRGLQHLSPVIPASNDRFIAIGDSLKRDIKFANQAGFLTIYKPANFMGIEEPSEPDEEPFFKIQSFDELPPLLETMGIVDCA